MKLTKPVIDPANGHVTSIDGRVVHPHTKLTELDQMLYAVSVYVQEDIARAIATTGHRLISETSYEIQVIFENDRLRKVCVQVIPSEHRELSDEAWYEADKVGYHERLLTAQLGKARTFAWGRAEVIEDKSGNAMIVLFYA